MQEVHHQLAIQASASKVYAALTDPTQVGQWWCPQTLIETAQGRFMEHHAGPYGTVRLQIVGQVANTRVVWACVGKYAPDNPACAWLGTQFIFELSDGTAATSGAALVERACSSKPLPTLTIVDFRQPGYDMNGIFAGFNNPAWGQVLESLKRFCE